MKKCFIPAAVFLAGALLLVCGPARAGEKDKKAKVDADMEAWMKAASPGPEHKRLDALVGSWEGTVTMWMDPSKPPTESKCTAERKWVLGGRFLHEEVKGEFMGMPFQGVGLTGYDNTQKKYTAMWVDNLTTSISTSLGTADESGNVLTFTKEDVDPVSGKKVKGRDVVNLAPDKNTMEMYKEGPDGKEMKVMEIIFTRKAKTERRVR